MPPRVAARGRTRTDWTATAGNDSALSGGVFVCLKAPTTPIISRSISCDPEVVIAVVAAEGSEILVAAGNGATPSRSLHL